MTPQWTGRSTDRQPRPLISHLPASVRHVGGLSAGTVAGQAVLLAASPFLTRLYSPSEFGTFSALMGYVVLLATVCSLSYPTAIPVASEEREASDLLWMTVFASAAIAPSAALITLLVLPEESGWAEWGVLAAGAGLLSVWAGLRGFAARRDGFGAISVSGVTDSATQAGIQLGLGQLSAGSTGLVLGYLAGKVAAVALLVVRLRRSVLGPHRPLHAARTWIRYSVWGTPTTLLNQLSVGAVAPVVASLYGAAVAGQLSLATRMLAVPSALLGQAVATVFFPKLARAVREGRSGLTAVEAVATGLSVVAWPVFGVTLLLGPELFSLVFGPQWRDAGVAAAALSPWLALSLVSSPISSVATVRDRLPQLLALGVLEASARIAALSLGASSDRWHLSLWAYSGVGCVISLYTVAWVLRLSGGSLRHWLSTWSAGSWTLVVLLCGLALLKPITPHGPFIVAATVLCSFGLVSGSRQIIRLMRSPQPSGT